jgi:hypothetical protein
MRVIAHNNCSSGPCPKLYEDDDGSLYVQGYVVTDEERKKINLPNGEELVRIDRDLFNNIRKA